MDDELFHCVFFSHSNRDEGQRVKAVAVSLVLLQNQGNTYFVGALEAVAAIVHGPKGRSFVRCGSVEVEVLRGEIVHG